jgi:hypothetical protein
MLERWHRTSRSDQPQSALDALEPKLRGPAAGRSSGARGSLDSAVEGWRTARAQPRLVVSLALIAAGVTWAIARGLQFYGLAPAHVVYDLDQPPLLLVLVAAWLVYRSRRR